MRRAFTTSTFLFLTLASASSALGAQTQDDFRLARIFTDHMVLQQEKPIEVWGWAPPAVEVRVTLTQDRDLGEAGGDFKISKREDPLVARP